MMDTLVVEEVSKSYGGVAALRAAGITVRGGTVHALLGENGAGKSTLIKVISGAVSPDSGSLSLHGRDVAFHSTAEAARNGVAVVSQELNLFGDLDVLANLYPMREPTRGPFRDRARMLALAEPVLAQLGLDVDPRRPLYELSLAQRQLVEIAKALIIDPKVLILDEPTSALEAASTERLLDVLRVLRDRQVAVVFVSHLLEEAMELCDEITVLRDGRTVLTGVPRDELDISGIVTAMLGRKHETPERPRAAGPARTEARQALRFSDVSVTGKLSAASFTAHPGEILGLAGLAGAGHMTALELVGGLARVASGRVLLPGDRPQPRHLRAAIAAGVAPVSGDRRRLGLMLDKPLWENTAQVSAVALGREGMVVRPESLRGKSRSLVARLKIHTAGVDTRCGMLSGGNQQKVVLAKWLDAEPSILLLDDPTRGVDISGKDEIHELLREAAAAGTIVLLRSTDLDELVALCARVLVFYRNHICGDLSGSDVEQHTILHMMNTGRQTA